MKALNKRLVLTLVMAYFGLCMALITPMMLTLALRVADIAPNNKESVLSWAISLGAFVALVTNPVVGLLSDRTTSRFGMRRPWIIAGTIISVAGLWLTATGSVSVLIVGWCMTKLGFNMAFAPVMALLPDHIPKEYQGRVSGLFAIAAPLSVLSGFAIVNAVGHQNLILMFMLPALICVVCVTGLLLVLPDRVLHRSQLHPLTTMGFLKSFWISPTQFPDFSFAFICQFLMFCGIAFMQAYQVFFLMDTLKISSEAITPIMLKIGILSVMANVMGSAIGGWLSDKFKRRKVFVITGTLIFAFGLYCTSIAHDLNDIYRSLAIMGFGQGIYFAVDLAMVTELLPNKDTDAAKDMGIFNFAKITPQIFAPAVAPFFLAMGQNGDLKNYSVVLFISACCAVLAALAVVPIRGVR